MSKQPTEALRLAEVLDTVGAKFIEAWKAAAELSRRYDSLEDASNELLDFAEEVRRTGDTRLANMAIAVLASARAKSSAAPAQAARAPEPAADSPELPEAARRALELAAQINPFGDVKNAKARDAAKAVLLSNTPKAPYTAQRIAWELERTALGDGFFGHALRVAKDIPGISGQDKALLDRYAAGLQTRTDHVALQQLALKIHKDARTAEQA